MNKNTMQFFYQADGTQGGDPAGLNFDTIGIIFAERIMGINDKDTPERPDPRYPNSTRFNNYPRMDNSPLNPPVYNCDSLYKLGKLASEALAAEHSEAKKAGIDHKARFLTASVATDKELIDLRLYSFDGLPDATNKDYKGNSPHPYCVAGITRMQRVKFMSGGTVSYGKATGKIVKEDAPVPAEAAVVTAAPAAVAKPAVV